MPFLILPLHTYACALFQVLTPQDVVSLRDALLLSSSRSPATVVGYQQMLWLLDAPLNSLPQGTNCRVASWQVTSLDPCRVAVGGEKARQSCNLLLQCVLRMVRL